MINSSKIFLVGGSGSGKTTFAKKYSEENGIFYIDNDMEYGKKCKGFNFPHEGTQQFLQNLPSEFIADGTVNDMTLFLEYIEKNNPQFIYVFCSDEITLMRRILKKIEEKHYSFPKRGIHSLICESLIRSTTKLSCFEGKAKPTIYYDSFLNDYTTREEFLKRMQWAI